MEQVDSRSTDGRSLQSHRSGLSSSQVEGEVVSVALVHHFHAEAGTVQHISPGVQDAALTIKDGLVEVEPFRLKAMVDTPRAVNQMPTTGQAARKK